MRQKTKPNAAPIAMPTAGPLDTLNAAPMPTATATGGPLAQTWVQNEGVDSFFIVGVIQGKTGARSQAHLFAKILSLSSAQFDFYAALQDHKQATAKPRFDLINPREVNDLASIRAKE